MTISITRYVDITSAVGAGVQVPTRALGGRIFTDNNLVPPQSFISFNSAAEVLSYFGASSEEYARAVFYFGWVSKNTTTPQQLQFARWVDTAVAPMIFGAKLTTSLSQFNLITNGSFGLTMGTFTFQMSGIDFSAAGTLAAVAADLQTAIRAQTGGGALWTSATVTYDSTPGAFNLVGGTTGAAAISVQTGTTGTDISSFIGWLISGAILAPGSAVETIQESLANSIAANNNFGSFTIMANVTLDQIIAAAQQNQTYGVNFIFTQAVSLANYAAWSDPSTGLGLIGGSTLTLAPLETEFPEQVPMMILAATNYLAPNSVQDYMFQQFDLTPSVSDDMTADQLDAARVNYYGVTQNAGVQLAFYQRGLMFGIATDPLDQNTYANEVWLKAALTAQLMTLLLALPQVAVNSTGRAQILAILQSVITVAVNNGTISVGKQLSTIQQLFITQITGDPNAWYQVQTIGYWVDVTFEPIPNTSPIQYQAVYTLVYSKDDVVRKVVGSDTLI